MPELRKKIELSLLLLAVVSCVLVSFSTSNLSLAIVGTVGAIIGFVITDRQKIFSLDGWLANLASVVILYLVFRDFSNGDQAQKLEAVGQLLVYLQTILMFQAKSTRLVWQILALSILQVSIAAIFSLEFDAGLLFPFYFILAGVTMVLQTIYCHRQRVTRANRRFAYQTKREDDSTSELTERNEAFHSPSRPIVVQEAMPLDIRLTDKRFFQFGLRLFVSAAFATLAFCVLPRFASPWFGPEVHQVTTAGMMTAVDLEQRGKVRLSKSIVFRASFKDAKTDKPLKNLGSPYFRAIAFSKLEIKDGKTSFTAPYDRVYDEVYQSLPIHRSQTGRPIRQVITLEKTTDPLVYGTMPVFKIPKVTPDELRFCHEISAYTRCREKQEISLAPYAYEMGTLLDHRGRFLKSWPFVSNTRAYSNQPLSRDPEYRSWLVKMDRERYPGVVATADRITAESKGSSRLAVAQKMVNFFQQRDRFFYTLDFTQVTMDKRIDPIEDFFSNHRKGHCELYAAALTLMLRSQDIPARLVVGFHGSEYNTLTNSFFVRGTDAHAWVEVYLRPGDCTPQMNFDGAAGAGGAWMILDPTPLGIEADEVVGRGSAIEMARSYWQDYVLGMEGVEVTGGSASVPDSLVRFMSSIDVLKIDQVLKRSREVARSPRTRWMVLLLIVLAVTLRMAWKSLRQKIGARVRDPNRKNKLVALFADAISAIAPAFGNWVRNVSGNPPSTQFYRQLTQLLSEHGLKRKELQTQLSFANEVAARVSNHRYGDSLGKIVVALTKHYHAIRFGNQSLDERTRAIINGQLEAVQVALQEAPLASATEAETGSANVNHDLNRS